MSNPSQQHAEAYALMEYVGLGVEPITVWNSRDGVTPLVIHHNGIERTHADWSKDRYAPDHLPEVGDLVFVDLTAPVCQHLADDYMEANWEAMRQEAYYADQGREHCRREIAMSYLQQAWGGAPYYLEATEELRHALTSLQGASRVNTESDSARWEWNAGDPFYTCSYCGSIHPTALATLLKTQGAHFSGSDWKYGYPHKFYLDVDADLLYEGSPEAHMKFYTRHLADLPDGEMKAIADLIELFFSIRFNRADDGRLAWKAKPNTQRWGVVP